jgi:hypothetical protein
MLDRSGWMPSATNSAQGPGSAGASNARFVPSINPVSSKVSRTAASARARADSALGRSTCRMSFASTLACSGAATGIKRSDGSTPPPGNTNLPGMKA